MDDYSPGTKRYMRIVRRMLQDYEINNKLIEGVELNDEDLALAVALATSRYNVTPPPIRKHTPDSFPSTDFILLAEGAVLEALRMATAGHARNDLPYNDAGGISVQDDAMWKPYMAIINQRAQTWEMLVRQYKQAENVKGAFGAISSAYAGLYPYFDQMIDRPAS